ncbi:CapA family protein [Nocardioides sp. SYSU D00065]|uniref:CapA family protein n=1 Tax=Nocardioides sp. SYSU D00065 TaxID=2817378 RepID=UPI001B32D8EB|nr:CapA family protein [Nocardioides sp. SYSU D00065]
MDGRVGRVVAVLGCVLLLAGCTASAPGGETRRPESVTTTTAASPAGEITLAFGGDVHFEGHVAALLRRPGATLGPISRTLRAADVAMVNLETAVTARGRRDPKELELPQDRYHFRTTPRALDVLADSGVDVVSVANNHAGDYGSGGLADTLAAARARGLAPVGAGRGAAAHAAHVVDVRGREVAFLAADGVQREGASEVWSAGPGTLGTASARGRSPDQLLDAVSAAAARDQIVVVYLHWGKEYQRCPTQSQRLLARDLAAAGADVVVGAHTHVLGGAGWSRDTFVAYGLGNLAWYNARQSASGVLTVTLDGDGGSTKSWTPARISATDGRPVPLTGAARARAVADWRAGQRCSGLAAEPGGAQADDPPYAATVSPIDAELAERMRGTSHRPGCPVPLADLRHLTMTHRSFDGVARTGEMVVHRRFAREVTEVFGRLYDAGWPIARMRLVDDYGGDDDASMAANNTSGFNCRRVAGQPNWSDHAYGAAIDLNPLQNPYVRPGSVVPPAGRRYARIDRSRSAPVPTGAIRDGDLPVAAFARIGWQWGGHWSSTKDYQHVAASDVPRSDP